MKTLYKDDKYIANYEADKDCLSVLKMNFCLPKYITATYFDVGMCGKEIMELKINGLLVSYNWEDVFDFAGDLGAKKVNVRTLHKLNDIAGICLDKIFDSKKSIDNIRTVWYCPSCGSTLENVYGSEFSCTNDDCVFKKNVTLTVFHPIKGVNENPGDSWAIGYIK